MSDNLLYYGDNLDVLRRHGKDESVDLVYLDPPLGSNQDYPGAPGLSAERPVVCRRLCVGMLTRSGEHATPPDATRLGQPNGELK
jgi:hypothetical protein